MNSSENIRMAMVRWLDYHPSATLSLVDLSIAMEKSVKRHGAVLAPFYHEMASHIEAQDANIVRYEKALRDIRALLPNPTLPITHAIRDIASEALSQKDTP